MKKKKCLIFHKWNGCKCSKCNEIRNEGHEWNGCKCTVCGRKRTEGHLMNGCVCTICGYQSHQFNSKAKKMSMCICINCGKEEHYISGTTCSCKWCGTTLHSWEKIADGHLQCRRCRKIIREVVDPKIYVCCSGCKNTITSLTLVHRCSIYYTTTCPLCGKEYHFTDATQSGHLWLVDNSGYQSKGVCIKCNDHYEQDAGDDVVREKNKYCPG